MSDSVVVELLNLSETKVVMFDEAAYHIVGEASYKQSQRIANWKESHDVLTVIIVSRNTLSRLRSQGKIHNQSIGFCCL